MSVTVIVLFPLLMISPIIALYEGENCTISKTGQIGKCISVLSCEHAKKLLQSQQRPQNCGFNSRDPLVCCPDKVNLKTPYPGSRSIAKCNEYHGREIFAVAMGFNALPKEFPHMVALGYGDLNNIVWLCGGTLISDKFVLTAAHCTISKNFGKVAWARLGDLDLKSTTDEANPLDLSVVQIFVHPDYKPPPHYNDIALLKLKEVIYFGLFYKPACLHVNYQLPFDKFQVAGWGKTDYLGETSSHLMKVDLDIIDFKRCSRGFSGISTRKLPNGIVDDIQICAGDLLGTGKDTCPGDSGGPLHFKVPRSEKLVQHFVVVGVTSFGKGCGIGSTIGGYSRVSAYIEWIENIVWPAES